MCLSKLFIYLFKTAGESVPRPEVGGSPLLCEVMDQIFWSGILWKSSGTINILPAACAQVFERPQLNSSDWIDVKSRFLQLVYFKCQIIDGVQKLSL